MSQNQNSPASPRAPRNSDHRLIAAESIDCPFQVDQNPHCAAAALEANAWYRRLFGDSPFAEKVFAAQMEQLTAGFYPQAQMEQLVFANRLLLWAFTVDDLADETEAGRQTSQLAALLSRFQQVMHGEAPDPAEPLELALAELMEGYRAFGDAEEELDFIQAMAAYFGAMLWEANNRLCGWVPDLGSYQMLRPAAGAVPPFWHLIGPVNNVRLPDDTSCRNELDRLSTLAGRLVCWHNDVLSHEKERAAGDVHNLCIVLEHARRLSPQAALRDAVRFANEEVAEFESLAEDLIAQEPAESVVSYVETLKSMVAATVEWTSSSRRYVSPVLDEEEDDSVIA